MRVKTPSSRLLCQSFPRIPLHPSEAG